MWNKVVNILQLVSGLSEVWALLIPLLSLYFIKVDRPAVKEIITYLWIALLLNVIIILITYLPDIYGRERVEQFPFLLQNNTIEYNILSIVRVILFTLYFIRNGQTALRTLKKTILGFFLAFVVINFSFFESPVSLFSSRVFTAESVVLLFFCVYYFLDAITKERHEKITRQPIFWVATGLSIYEAVNFFIFLLFKYLINNYTVFAQHIWNLHNISFIILCLFITKAFYESRRK